MAPIAIVFTVCQGTPSSTVIAETVVLSIINRRNTYRAHRPCRGWSRCSLLAEILIEHRAPQLGVTHRYRGIATRGTKRVAGDRQIGQRPDYGVAVAVHQGRAAGRLPDDSGACWFAARFLRLVGT